MLNAKHSRVAGWLTVVHSYKLGIPLSMLFIPIYIYLGLILVTPFCDYLDQFSLWTLTHTCWMGGLLLQHMFTVHGWHLTKRGKDQVAKFFVKMRSK